MLVNIEEVHDEKQQDNQADSKHLVFEAKPRIRGMVIERELITLSVRVRAIKMTGEQNRCAWSKN